LSLTKHSKTDKNLSYKWFALCQRKHCIYQINVCCKFWKHLKMHKNCSWSTLLVIGLETIFVFVWTSDAVKSVTFETETSLKPSRLRLYQKLRDLSILPKLCFEYRYHFWVEFFLFLAFSNMFWLFLTCKYNKQKSLNFRNFTKLFLCNIQSLETCSHWDQDSQIWVSRLHHWFRHKRTLHLLQRILVSLLRVRQWWSLEVWSWSRDFPFFESQSRRFEVLSWSAKIWLSKTFVNQRAFGLLNLQIRNNQSR